MRMGMPCDMAAPDEETQIEALENGIPAGVEAKSKAVDMADTGPWAPALDRSGPEREQQAHEDEIMAMTQVVP